MKTILQVAVSLAFLLPTLAAFAQDWNSHSHSHGSSSDRQYSEEEIRSRLERIDGYLRQIDRNGNGMLDADEATGEQRRMVEYLFERAGMRVTVPMPIAQLRQGAESYYRGRSSSMQSMATGFSTIPTPAPTSRSSSTSVSTPQVYSYVSGMPSMVPGFGTMLTPAITSSSKSSKSSSASVSTSQAYGLIGGMLSPLVPGFGVPGLGVTATSSTASTSKSASSKPGPDPRVDYYKQLDKDARNRLQDMGSMLMRKYDKDRNGQLDRDEWAQINGLGALDQAAGSRGDHIRAESLAIHLSDLMRKGILPMSIAGGNRQSSASAQVPLSKSGRFLTPGERLPKGLPSWFLKKDADSDGQVTMAEFSRDWDRQTVEFFERYDLNHDGIITAEECLKGSSSSR